MYIFPGVGLGVTVCKAKMITNKMLHRAALALASFVKEEDLLKGKVYPSIRQISRVSEAIALEGRFIHSPFVSDLFSFSFLTSLSPLSSVQGCDGRRLGATP